MKKFSLTVLIEKDEYSMYVAEVPDLKGCYAQGKTIGEVLENIKDVISLCLEDQKDIHPHEFVGVQKIEVSG